MAGYLEGYGERDLRRRKAIKWLLIAVAVVLICGPLLYLQFRDFAEERQIKAFLSHLRSKDYKAAYALWGCTDPNPCPQYPFEEFLKDWGPSSAYVAAAQAEIAGTKSCDTGVIGWVRFPSQPDVLVWVDRESDTLSFAPWRIKKIPDDLRHRLAGWMWNVTRNCKPLIQP